ncbi:MAG: T9SS type A sorting domain-containing protein [Bacteroidetes bacterium]|nr:T9SS type A sorting domain-containing protein [Bacteroidota bacterium]MBS1740276.1 T9SS type A sorting domain-containing protein [Bacteroidota bacterium]
MRFKLSLLALMIGVSASAQITINQSNYSAWTPRTDTAFRLDSTVPYPVLTPGTNAQWDLSTATYNTSYIWLYYRRPASSAIFTSATYADSLFYTINSNLKYASNLMGGITANGVQYFGEQVGRQAIPLVSLTGGMNDSLVFLGQNSTYSNAFNKLKFPATMGSNWSSNYNFTTNFTMSIAAYGMNNTPCQRKTFVTEKDTVVGWGKMRVLNRVGATTGYTNVLMVKTIWQQSDSFFVGGAPASTALLTAFGLTQGQINNQYQYNFFRAGEVLPLMSADYKDNTFSNTKVKNMSIHEDRLLLGTGINDIHADKSIVAYPNPITNGVVNLSIKDRSINSFDYAIINMNGQVVSRGHAVSNNGVAQLNCEALRVSGIYYVQLYNNNGQIATLPIDVK